MKLVHKKPDSPPAKHASGGRGLQLSTKAKGTVVGILLASNLLTFAMLAPIFSTPASEKSQPRSELSDLYLIDKAATYMADEEAFEKKVRKVAQRLDVPPEWLMAVMYSESRFNSAVLNRKGSGATGLIQFMPATARDYGTTVQKLGKMTPVRQMDYVYRYFSRVKKKYGSFDSLTELYLAVLYPKALSKDYCYTLYSKPSRAFRQNSGLDENKDGHVTVSDIDRRMRRVFPTAFAAMMGEEGEDQ